MKNLVIASFILVLLPVGCWAQNDGLNPPKAKESQDKVVPNNVIIQSKVISGTAIGDVTYAPGKFGLAASLDCKTIDGQKHWDLLGIDYPCTTATFTPKEGTFSCWVNAPIYSCLTVYQVGSDPYGLGIWWTSGGAPYFPFIDPGLPGYADGWCANTILENCWTHLAFTWNYRAGAPTVSRVYVNGVEDTRSPLYPPQIPMASTIHMAKFPPGMIDDIVFLDKALTGAEVQELYSFGKPFVPDIHTRLYINFDGSSTNGISVTQ